MVVDSLAPAMRNSRRCNYLVHGDADGSIMMDFVKVNKWLEAVLRTGASWWGCKIG